MPEMNEKVRLLSAVTAIAVSTGVLFTSLVGWHYESKINGMERRHSIAMSQLIRSHKKELLEDNKIIMNLGAVEREIQVLSNICKGK